MSDHKWIQDTPLSKICEKCGVSKSEWHTNECKQQPSDIAMPDAIYIDVNDGETVSGWVDFAAPAEKYVRASTVEQQPSDTQRLNEIVVEINRLIRIYTPNGNLAEDLCEIKSMLTAAMEQSK